MTVIFVEFSPKGWPIKTVTYESSIIGKLNQSVRTNDELGLHKISLTYASATKSFTVF
jgi:hypothetical protein